MTETFVAASHNGTSDLINQALYKEKQVQVTRLIDSAYDEYILFTGALLPVELLTINNSYGAANMKLSTDGKKLLLYHFTGAGVLGVKPAGMLVYNLAGNYQMADATGQPYTGDPAAVPVISQISIPDGTISNSSVEFSATGSYTLINW